MFGALGAWLLWESIRRGYYLHVKCPNDVRKLRIRGEIQSADLGGFVKNAAKLGYQFEPCVDAQNTLLTNRCSEPGYPDFVNKRNILRILLMLALTGALVVSGLLNHSPVDSSEIRPVRSDDGEMNAAMQRARDTFPEFWREVSADNQRAIPVLKGKIVKACFDDAGGASAGPEHMWVSNLQYDGQVISGVLADTPHHLRSFKKGQSVNLPLERLSDWLYVADGKAVGAFTIQVFRSHMTPQERQAHDSDYPFRFE